MRNKIVNIFDLLLFGARTDDRRPASMRRRTLRRSLFAIMLVLTTVPLCISVGLSFYQYRNLLNEETAINVKGSAESARQTIEAFIGRLQAAIQVLSDAYTFEELSNEATLTTVFSRLKKEQPGLVDLSVIGADGIQRSYVGPYDLKGKDYSSQDWFKVAMKNELYVSEVFLGYRKVPHFIVSVSKQTSRGKWLIRASINSETLDQFLGSVNSELIEDLFLINDSGALQTFSRHGMVLFERISLSSDFENKSGLLYEKSKDRPIVRAYGKIKNTPWTLVLDQQDYVVRKHWLSFTSQLLLIVALCALLSSLVIIRIAGYLARRIVEAEQGMEAALSQTEHTNRLAALGRLAGGVAHEINNPLAIINEKAGLLLDLMDMSDDFPNKPRIVKHMLSLQKAVVRARDITHRLLGFSRRLDQKMEDVAVNSVIREVLSFIDKEALYRNIKIELDLNKDLPTIRGDIGQLQQVVLNIINNAMDALPEFGLLRISTKSGHGRVFITIFDNGPGMPEEVVQKIFEPFFTTKTGKGKTGTGLGLFITYGIVKKLGGEVAVESVPGNGTSFDVSFPISEHYGGAIEHNQSPDS